MRSIWLAATIGVVVTGYFVWAGATAPQASRLQIADCHRLAGEISAIHAKGDTIPSTRTTMARACAVSFGQDWASDTSQWAAGLRAEGASRAQ